MSLISKEHLRLTIQNLKDVFNRKIDEKIKDSTKNSVADWNENDSTADSYIKNRTHWEEEAREIEILPETTIEIDLENQPYAEASDLPFTANQEYIVNWNGTQYSCKAYYTSDGGVAIGNGDLFIFGDNSGCGNSEPFFYASYIGDFGGIFASESGIHTISISTIEAPVHHLDPKYIKDMYHEYMAPNRDIIIEERTITAEDDYSFVDIEIENFLTEGATYIVTWNDQTYTCTARYDAWGDLYIGNQLIGSEADGYEFPEIIESNEPFFFCTYEPDNWRSLIVQTAGEYNIKIVGTGEKLTPYQIDIKYIPDNIKYDIKDLQWQVGNLDNNIYNKMDKNNPVGTGSFSMNRKPNTAIGNYSHAEGYDTIASGDYSHAEGYNTVAKGGYSHAEGKYNIEDTANKYAHIIGNGTSDSARSNAHTLDWEGNAWYQGDVYVNSTSGTNRDEGSKKLATVDEANEIAETKLSILTTTFDLPSKGYMWSSTYGNGKFVAIARSTKIAAYSEDGITWAMTIMPSAEFWNSVVYGNGKFVAVANATNIAAYSEDGITWSSITMPSEEDWQSVTYGNGKFVAIASGIYGKAAYSEDGITWTLIDLTYQARQIQSVTYGNGKFIAVKHESKSALYSTDGIVWSSSSSSLPEEGWTSITYGNGKFVAVASADTFEKTSVAAYSEDGITWSSITMPSEEDWTSITYGNGKFVAVAGYASRISEHKTNVAAYSTDGIEWNIAYMPMESRWTSVTCGNDKFIAIAKTSDVDDVSEVVYSYDGINWRYRNLSLQQNNTDVTDMVKEVVLEDINKKIDNLHAPQSHFTLIDDTTSYEYIIRMQNGNLTSICKASSLAVSTLPTKTTYTIGETLDLTDMVVTLTRQDGTTEEVNNYSYTEPDMSVAGTVDVTVSYVEAGETYSATFTITINEATTTEETESETTEETETETTESTT